MTQYLLLIHGNAKTASTQEDWERFFAAASESGMFRGGSEIGKRVVLGDASSPNTSDHIAGYMRFDTDDRMKLLDLLKSHPVLLHGGSVELCEMPKTE